MHGFLSPQVPSALCFLKDLRKIIQFRIVKGSSSSNEKKILVNKTEQCHKKQKRYEAASMWHDHVQTVLKLRY
jgi:putative cell wall-binding protein